MQGLTRARAWLRASKLNGIELNSASGRPTIKRARGGVSHPLSRLYAAAGGQPGGFLFGDGLSAGHSGGHMTPKTAFRGRFGCPIEAVRPPGVQFVPEYH